LDKIFNVTVEGAECGPEKTTEEIRLRKEAIDRQSAEFNQWMTRIKARLEAIAGKIERAKNNTK
jgi:hypothetical protein